MFKMMEQGQLLAKDILPKVAKEYARVARTNGALGAAVLKTRAELNRLQTSMTATSDTIYKGGFGAGLAYLFKGMTRLLNSSQGLAQMFGVFLKSSIATVTLPLELLGVVIKHVGELFGQTSHDAITFATKLAGVAAAVWGIIKAFKILRSIVGGVKTAGSAVGGALGAGGAGGAGGLAAGAGAPLMATLGMATGTGLAVNELTERSGLVSMQHRLNQTLETLFTHGSMNRPNQVSVDVKVNDGKVEGLIEAKVNQSNNDNINSILSSGTK